MLRMILVDENKVFYDGIKKLLADVMDLHVFDSSVDALLQIVALSPDIIVSEVGLPGIDGISMLTVAKSVTKSAATIAISTKSREELSAYKNLSSHTFFNKPLSEEFFDYFGKTALDIYSTKNASPDEQRIFRDKLAKLHTRYKNIA